jgi:hypothetical protein
MVILGFAFFALVGATFVHAVPLLVPRQSISTLTAAQVASFKPYSRFASSAYCKPANTLAWNCGGELIPFFDTGDKMTFIMKKLIVTPIPDSSLQHLVVTVLQLSFGMSDMTQP